MTSRFHIMALWCVMHIHKRPQNTTSITAEILTKFCSTINTGSRPSYSLSCAPGAEVAFYNKSTKKIHKKSNQWSSSIYMYTAEDVISYDPEFYAGRPVHGVLKIWSFSLHFGGNNLRNGASYAYIS